MKTPTCRLVSLGLGCYLFSLATLSAQWVAFNDHAPGAGTHANATRYHLFGNGAPSAGPLRHISNGTNLSASLTMSHSGSGVAPNDNYGSPFPGTPVANIFNGFVDFGGAPSPSIEVLASSGGLVSYSFSNLDPAQRYRFHGSAIRGGPTYTDRWTVCEIVGAIASINAHSSNVLTAAQVPGALTASQAALNTGVNNTSATGDYVSWDDIQPASNGSFAVTCRQYTGPVPGGSSAGVRAYALNGLRLEEISQTTLPVAIIMQPPNQTVYAGSTATFSADAAGNPLFYQWYKDGEALAGATNRVFSQAGVTTSDGGVYSFIVSNTLNSVPSSNAMLTVIVPQMVGWGRDDLGQTDVPFGLSNVVMMAAGSWHGLALQGDGTTIAWGRNTEGQISIPPDVTNPAVIAAGYNFSMALMPARTVRCWGDNFWGQCSPPAGLSNVVMIAPGYDHALALKGDGTVVAWGRNSYGQASVPAGLSNVVRIFAGGYSSFALRANGAVSAWGLNDNAQLSVPPALTNLIALAPGNLHTLGLTSEGRVWAWGNNGYGQCSVPAGLSRVVAIAVGGGYSGSHSLALQDDGTVVAWGYNNSGQTTLPPSLPKAVRIAGGEYYSMALNATDPTKAGPALLPSPFVMAVLGQPFHHRLAVRNGPAAFSASGLPPDLALDTSSGLLNGIPSSVGTFSVALRVMNALGADERSMTLIIQSNSMPPVVFDPLAFPLSANQRGTVSCLENSTISYDVYLPPGYATNGAPLPILYTMNPNGGGMVGDLQSVCSSLNMIAIGITGSRNDVGWDTLLREFYAVSRDVRQRLLFDPTAEFVGGFSGGGECAYLLSRVYAQHVAGVFAMAGWLGRTSDYYTTDRVQTNLLVARSTGASDTGGNYYLAPDGNFLTAGGAVIQDWSFSGGHSVPPESVQSACLGWLLSRRIPAGPDDQANALAEAAGWRSRALKGEREIVLRECVQSLMHQPRSWRALQAQLVLDDLMSDYDSLRPLAVDNLAPGDFASDLFYYSARGAADVGDWPRYWSCLKALSGITGTCGDRLGDIRSLLVQNGYPASALVWSAQPVATHQTRFDLWMTKDSPGLDYGLQARADVAGGIWQDISIVPRETSTSWSVEIVIPLGTTNGLYRVWATPSAATNSPPLPM